MKTINENIIKRAAHERGHANHGWLDARHFPTNRGEQLRVQQYVLMACGVGVGSNDR